MLRILIALAIFATPALAQNTDKEASLKEKAAKIKHDTQEMLQGGKEALSKLEERLSQLKKARIVRSSQNNEYSEPSDDKKFTFPTKEVKAKAIKILESRIVSIRQRIEKFEKGEEFVYSQLQLPAELGSFGTLARVHVRQVIDDNSMLVNYTPAIYSEGVTPAGVNSESVLFKMKGIATKGTTDGRAFDVSQVFEVTDTETYPTANGGTNTVFIIEPFDMSKLEPYLKDAK